ncbi:hypothetical protein MNBD_NITROSPINAE05-1093 [hydrothermal vent metagenome]|uniref:Uncharacterized protein n=1 Tax=hydrothermal vent metagenome TaxID=652676 RepID=A0A3B1CZJ9_9ZZZZ
MQDVRTEPNFQHQRTLAPGQTRAIVVISGKGLIVDEASARKTCLQEKYFAVVLAKNGATISLKAGRGLRITSGNPRASGAGELSALQK